VEDLATPASVPVAAPLPTAAVGRRGWWWLAGAGLLVVASGCALWMLNRPGKLIVPAPVPLTTYPGSQASPSFSPEGDRVAFLLERAQAGQVRHLRQADRRRRARPSHEGPGR
jgi:hypothetical protein